MTTTIQGLQLCLQPQETPTRAETAKALMEGAEGEKWPQANTQAHSPLCKETGGRNSAGLYVSVASDRESEQCV